MDRRGTRRARGGWPVHPLAACVRKQTEAAALLTIVTPWAMVGWLCHFLFVVVVVSHYCLKNPRLTASRTVCMWLNPFVGLNLMPSLQANKPPPPRSRSLLPSCPMLVLSVSCAAVVKGRCDADAAKRFSMGFSWVVHIEVLLINHVCMK